jgi:seryl-tRNA synthetase
LLNKENAPKITEVEISLMNFQGFAAKKPLTNAIIQEYYRLLFEELMVMKRVKQKEEKDCSLKMEEITSSVTELKSILNQHNKLMNDIKPLLKIMSKEENSKIQDYTKTYQRFSENCNELIRFLSNEEAIEMKSKEILLNISILKEVVPK